MDLTEHLRRAFDLISAIPVTGDAVDLMCAARQEIRTVFSIMSALEQNESKEVAQSERDS